MCTDKNKSKEKGRFLMKKKISFLVCTIFRPSRLDHISSLDSRLLIIETRNTLTKNPYKKRKERCGFCYDKYFKDKMQPQEIYLHKNISKTFFRIFV